MSSELMDAYWAAPPMARTLTTAIVFTSFSAIIGKLLLGWQPYVYLYFTEDRLFRFPPELWRLVTSFLVTRPQIGLILDPYFGMGALANPLATSVV